MAFLELEGIEAGYDDQIILRDFNLNLERGELLTLLGPSGCGKTTTLRVIAGFIRPRSGTVRIDGRVFNDVPPHKRNIGIVFQSYALFPHMNVFENVAFGLRMRKMSKGEIEKKVKWALDLVGLSGFEGKLPKQLSGGQQQRVAIARAIVIEPQLLLMDEPLSNLDAKLRLEMRGEIRALQKKLGITTVYVTHDQSEALAISDRIAVMKDGRIVQLGTPEEIYTSPVDPYVAEFVGFQKIARGILIERDGKRLLKLDEVEIEVNEGKAGKKYSVMARRGSLSFGEKGIPARILTSVFLGDSVLYRVESFQGFVFEVEEQERSFEIGSDVKVMPRSFILFEEV